MVILIGALVLEITEMIYGYERNITLVGAGTWPAIWNKRPMVRVLPEPRPE